MGLVDHSKLAVLDAFASQMEADLAKSELDSAGIDSMIQADRAGGMRDHLAWSGLGFKVLVREEDLDEARQALHQLHKAPEGKLVVVPYCGSQAEAEVAQGALASVNIAAAVEPVMPDDKNSSLSLMGPCFRLLVAEKDAAAARDALNS